jgi:hypothetical protein
MSSGSRAIWAIGLTTGVFALFASVGCYESKFPLGSADTAEVNPAFVGDYTYLDKPSSTQPSSLTIRNIDGKLYYVELDPPDARPSRAVGFTFDINGVTFANTRGLEDDGTIPDGYTLMRVALSDDHSQLTIRQLSDDFFKGKTIGSSDDLERIISDNLDNKAMYDSADDTIVATRVVHPK